MNATYSNRNKRLRYPAPFYYPAIKNFATVGIQTSNEHATKLPISYTSTKTQNKKKSQPIVVSGDHEVIQTGFSLSFYKPLQQYMRSGGKIQYSQFVDGVVAWDSGRQQRREMFEVFNIKQFTDASTVSPNPAITFPDNLFELDPNQATTGGSDVIAPGVSATKQKLYLKTVKIQTEYVNLSSVPCVVEIRWCSPKVNTHRGPLDEWNTQNDTQIYGQPLADQNVGGITGIASAGYPYAELPGKIPETIKGWNDKWAILKKENFILNGGCRVKSFCKFYMNFLADKETMVGYALNKIGNGSLTEPVRYIRGLTVVPFMIVRSVPMLAQKEGIVERMAYAPGKIGFLSQQWYTVVPDAIDQKFPYERMYPSTLAIGGNKTFFQQINVEDQMDDIQELGV